jgi:hypothetical protein
MVEFGTQDKPCYFCGHPQTVGFKDHFVFCPNCLAVYTFVMVHEAKCEHVKVGTPAMIRLPDAFVAIEDKEFFYGTRDGQYRCATCDTESVIDGW